MSVPENRTTDKAEKKKKEAERSTRRLSRQAVTIQQHIKTITGRRGNRGKHAEKDETQKIVGHSQTQLPTT